MTPLILILLLTAAVAFLALALWSGEGVLGVVSAVFFLLIAFGLFTSGLQEQTGKVTTTNTTNANLTSSSETITTSQDTGLIPRSIMLVSLLLAALMLWLAYGLFGSD